MHQHSSLHTPPHLLAGVPPLGGKVGPPERPEAKTLARIHDLLSKTLCAWLALWGLSPLTNGTITVPLSPRSFCPIPEYHVFLHVVFAHAVPVARSALPSL